MRLIDYDNLFTENNHGRSRTFPDHHHQNLWANSLLDFLEGNICRPTAPNAPIVSEHHFVHIPLADAQHVG